MKVKDLIQKLSKGDQNLDVVLSVQPGDFRQLVHVEECMVGDNDYDEKPALVLWWSLD